MSNDVEIVMADPGWPASAYVPGTAMYWQRLGWLQETARVYYLDPIKGSIAETADDIKDWSTEQLEELAKLQTELGQMARDMLAASGAGIERWATNTAVAGIVVGGVVIVGLGVAAGATLLAWTLLK